LSANEGLKSNPVDLRERCPWPKVQWEKVVGKWGESVVNSTIFIVWRLSGMTRIQNQSGQRGVCAMPDLCRWR